MRIEITTDGDLELVYKNNQNHLRIPPKQLHGILLLALVPDLPPIGDFLILYLGSDVYSMQAHYYIDTWDTREYSWRYDRVFVSVGIFTTNDILGISLGVWDSMFALDKEDCLKLLEITKEILSKNEGTCFGNS